MGDGGRRIPSKHKTALSTDNVTSLRFLPFHSYLSSIKRIHSNSPNPGSLGPGTAHNSEMSVFGNSHNSTAKVLFDITLAIVTQKSFTSK